MTKNLLFAAALAAAFVAPASAQVAVGTCPVLQGPNGSYVSAACAGNLSYVGANVYRVEVSTPADTAILLATGAGELYGVQCGSGTSSGFGIAFDSASASGITFTTTGKAIMAPLYSPGTAATSFGGQGIVDFNEAPEQFHNGLVFLTHGIAIDCYIKARLNLTATSNPNPGP